MFRNSDHILIKKSIMTSQMTNHFVQPDEIPQIVDDLRSYFKTGTTKPLSWRMKQLNGLVKALEEHEDEWIAAMGKDMGSHKYEAGLLVKNVTSEIKHTINELESWLYPKNASNPLALYPGTTELVFEPYGVVCDFIPFNYPVFLGFSTLLPILASGNCCLFKPSSNTPACALLYHQIFPKYLDQLAVRVVCGPTSICDEILKCRFDFIFYTGSPAIGKLVMKAAAEHLTPVLLELGGKSPVYIDKNVSLKKCCRRLAFGKFFNGGQTCVCPDYVMVHQDILPQFRQEMVNVIHEFFGDHTRYNDNITHIISPRHFDRLQKLIETSGGINVIEGYRSRDRLYIGPTLVESPNLDSQMMTEEIFGPIIPFMKVSGPDEAISFINEREKPLALYVLSNDESLFQRFVNETSSGAIMMNDTTFHVSSPNAPFGGVGNSGMGQYHGKAGIYSLSHLKPVLRHGTLIDVSLRYPPYNDTKYNIIKRIA